MTTSAVAEEHYVPAIESTGRGWVIEEQGEIVAFAVGNAETGNIWALFVHPDHEGRGHGTALQNVMVRWLFEQGLERLYLETEAGTRAQGFYESTGWSRMGRNSRGEAIYERFAERES